MLIHDLSSDTGVRMMEYTEPRCCFDAAAYVGTPDAGRCAATLDVPEIVRGLDALYEHGRESEAESYLEGWLEKARSCGDWRAELTVTSELLGQYRRSANRSRGLAAVNGALELIRAHRMGMTVSGATVMLNAATTLKCFGLAADSIPIFEHVCRVYSDNLDPADYRFAGLFNNMALSYSDTGDYESAERCFTAAMRITEKCEYPQNELAVTLCNMAEMYDRQDHEDARIEDCLERAWEYLSDPALPHDGYHAFTISKCAPCFDYFGFFVYAGILKERAAKIYALS